MSLAEAEHIAFWEIDRGVVCLDEGELLITPNEDDVFIKTFRDIPSGH